MPHLPDSIRNWSDLRQRLVEYGIYEPGQRKKLALYLEVDQSQVTRWLGRPHPKEPPYSAGKKMERYLAAVPFIPSAKARAASASPAALGHETARGNCVLPGDGNS
jgi:hypothetical protein